MELQALNRKAAAANEINWVTTIFMAALSPRRHCRAFLLHLEGLFRGLFPMVGFGEPGHWHGLSPAADPPRVRTPKWLEYFLTLCATTALEGGPIFWVATHRIHHQFSDQDGDPHSPVDGKWWAHMGWILMGKSMHHDTTTLARYVPDLAKDKFHVWITKYHYVPMIVLGLVLLAIGGLPFLMWGIFVRTTLGLHATWMVNSVTHTWGSRRFATRDLSTNNWVVGSLFTWGEGWHNNHHAHPVSARHGLAWYEFDMNWYGIWLLKKLGLARHVYRVRLEKLPPTPAVVPQFTTLDLAEATSPAASAD